jgi:hypothetical protein
MPECVQREMTLKEWCNKLPDFHLVNKELKILLKRDEILTALESYGVDNWEGYSEALESLND